MVQEESKSIMKLMMKTMTFLMLLFVATSMASAQDNFELGKMWTFENAPKEYFKKEHNLDLTDEWLESVRLSYLKFGGGCSSSFVSPQGLIMTNHHCARGFIATAAPAGEDWVKDGYIAKNMAEEVSLAGLVCRQQMGMEDVTALMNKGIEASDDETTTANKRVANRKAILAAAAKNNPKYEPEIVALYQGGMYQVYYYRSFDDVRLVAAPHLQTAHFGGDPDNFTYPRFGIDFTFVRAYVDGKPYDSSAHYFKFNPVGPSEGESVFIPGNPGSTNRLMTKAELEYWRDVRAPIIRDHINMTREYLMARMKDDPSLEATLRPQFLRNENGKKAWGGYHDALLSEEFMAYKANAEALFKAKVQGDEKLAPLYGNTWDKIQDIAMSQRVELARNRVHNTLRNPLLSRALDLVRANDQSLPEGERNKAIKILEDPKNQVDLEMPKGADLHNLSLWLEHARKWAEKDDAYVAMIFPKMEAKTAVAKLFENSPCAKSANAAKFVNAGIRLLRDSDDAAIKAALALHDKNQENKGKLAALDIQLKVQKTRIGQALFAVYGTAVSPDATGTLRLSDGKVKGFPMNGTIAPWRTTFYGLFGRAAAFDNKYPFDLPQAWLNARNKIDLEKSVNFVATNDIIGGNSGSAVINRNREIVGLVFDGNIEMLGNNFVYKSDIPRSVSVHSAAIIEALSRVYKADRVVSELLSWK
ncbi:MAG: hypothetical protein ACI97A_002626 [Planctomycetota bacterium]